MAIPKVISYKIPDEWLKEDLLGKRVEVPLKNKHYSGLVIALLDEEESTVYKIKSIVNVLDDHPLIGPVQIQFWNWVSKYYCCTLGEVMNIALPTGLKLSSETKLIFNNNIEDVMMELDDKEYMIAEALQIQNELTIAQVQDILNQNSVYKVIRNLLSKHVLYIKEEIKEKYKEKTEDYIQLIKMNENDELDADLYLSKVERSHKQSRALLYILSRTKAEEWIAKKEVYKKTGADSTVIKALVKKNLIRVESHRVSRIDQSQLEVNVLPQLSDLQKNALSEIRTLFDEMDQVLLFGVTGSGKTRVYVDLIKEYLDQGKQVLYLIPEIALTTQLEIRLKSIFGEGIAVYHSRMNNNDRVELWNSARNEKQLFVGARSSLFLPYKELGLIILDEEHDSSYKQNDPAPRYQARDAAQYLAGLYGAKVLLGTATPSLETFTNTVNGKFGLVKMMDRFGKSILPEIKIVDLKSAYNKGLMRSVFSKELLDAIIETKKEGLQSILFQNRRGYAPTLHCKVCGWHAECPHCDVSLTVHKFYNELRCHYCGYKKYKYKECPSCGNHQLEEFGFGTEKIEESLMELIPELKVERLDYDTAKTKNSFQSIIGRFADGEIDVLVGTQMVTKGLDFDKIALVAILNADKMFYFPNFRASERAFQLLTQVAGRAGRRERQGKVYIQSFTPNHPVLLETKRNDFQGFYNRELEERKKFIYPPFYRLIEITIKHKDSNVANEAAEIMTKLLKEDLGKRIIGPTTPGISRLRGFYIRNVLVKMEKEKKIINYVKNKILEARNQVKSMDRKGNVRINIDVDP